MTFGTGTNEELDSGPPPVCDEVTEGVLNPRLGPGIWLALLGLAGAMRLVGLARFPGVQADEGFWTSASKNFVLFGDWFMDGRTHALLSPVFSALTVAVYTVFGASIYHARLITALASLASVPLMYAFAYRVTGKRAFAFSTAALLGLSAAYAFSGRQAMIEGTQVAIALAAAWLVARRDYRGCLLGGLAFGLALLTKINIIFLAPALALFALDDTKLGSELRSRGAWARMGLFFVTAITVASLVNLLLYLAEPERFVAAYRFELVGSHFTAAHPLVRLGRFGIDPALIAQSLGDLVRAAPFQMVLCVIGVGAVALGGASMHLGFWVWLVWGTAFVLMQNYQPPRYFFLAAPAYVAFAAAAIQQIRSEPGPRAWFCWNGAQAGVIAVYAFFNLSYLGLNAAAHRDDRLQVVREWVVDHTEPDERLLAASYFCVDVPNRAYSHYALGATDVEQLARSIVDLDIDYVIYDAAEWSPAVHAGLSARYPTVAEWPFGAVYSTKLGWKNGHEPGLRDQPDDPPGDLVTDP